MFNLSKKIAFTLAEILIVMAVIGVVAALTVPNLKDNSDLQVNAAKAKKVFIELSSALDRFTLKAHAKPADWTSPFAISGINNNSKIKGTGTDYWYDISSTCASNATGLDDGSTYCVIPYASSTDCLDVLFDIDGPKKGFNETGYDVFQASIRIPSTADSPEMVAWSCSDSGTFTTSIQPSATNYLNWVMLYDNLDYRKCADVLTYQDVTSCN